ncbi:hypothetical protein MHZ93_00540 [Roseomonas sp. ACRSG]|nr:hypothetical protein [Roseomonas sp. ACRSG]
MIGYAQLRPGSGFNIRNAAMYYTQRLVTWRGPRRLVCRSLAAAIRLRHGRSEGPVTSAARRSAQDLERDGLAMMPRFAIPGGVKGITEFLRGENVVGPDGRLVRLEDLPPGTRMASYPLASVVACPGLMSAINDPAVLQIASEYLGCKPTLSSLGVRWSFPSPARPAETQLFHRDPDDWRFLKLFVYLTDVDAESGPHAYVLGSHRTAATLRAKPYQRDALVQAYGADKIQMVTGPAGTTFMADTHGIHMGVPPSATPRLILQVQYSLLPIFAFRYEPVKPAGQLQLDKYVNRLVVA